MKKLARFSIYILLVLILTGVVKNFVFQRAIVDGNSMTDTLQDGDNLIVSKISAISGKYKRYDIIVFPYKKSRSVYYIKRIIGMPGETVEIHNGEVTIDGEILSEPYLTTTTEGDFGPHLVPDRAGHPHIRGLFKAAVLRPVIGAGSVRHDRRRV